jgi:hypothetical protein
MYQHGKTLSMPAILQIYDCLTMPEDYPSIKAHILPYKEKLEKRATKQEWFELQQAQLAYQPFFEKMKIVYGHFSPRPLFSMEGQASYSNDKSYIIPNADYYLLGLLHSSTYWFLISMMCPFVRGGYYEVRVQYIETLSIPNATTEEKEQVGAIAKQCQDTAEKRYKLQEAFRRRIVDLFADGIDPKLNTKLKNWWQLENFATFRKEAKKCCKQDIPLQERNDWQNFFEQQQAEIATLTNRITQLEADLNNHVYALFDLTADEIQLIDQELQGKM